MLNDVLPQYAKMLTNLDKWIEKAVHHAEKKKFDAEVFAHARLAPDQYTFTRQVQAACDAAKFAAAYLSGKEPPKHPDDEKTIAELRERIRKCLAFLETVGPNDLAGAGDRKVAPGWLKGKWFKGDQYVVQASIPNFYFHVTTAYAILRHNGVDLGKQDFMGPLPVRE